MARPLYTHWAAAPKGTTGVCDPLTRYPGVPLEIDLAKVVGRQRLVYDAPAGIWQEGLPLGNGDLAAMLFQPRGWFCWGLTKSDIRDLRNPVMPFHPHQEWAKIIRNKQYLDADWMNEEEWEFYRDDYFPCFLPAGGLFLREKNAGALAVTRQTLDLYTATHTAELRNGGRITSFVHHGANVLAVRLCGLRNCTFCLRLAPEALLPELPGYSDTPLAQTMRREVLRRVKSQWSADSVTQRVDYADGHKALTVLNLRGCRLTENGEDLAEAGLRIDTDDAVMLLTVTTAREAAYLQRRAERVLQGAWQRGIDRLWTDHCLFWHERWSRSVIQIPERVLEALWYYNLYLLASSGRGAYPVPLMSAWNLRFDQPFHGDYHNNINAQMCHWPLFTANHADLAESYIRHFWAVLPEMEAETRRVWNLPGVKVPFACAGRGLDFWGVGYWKYEFFVSAWTAQIAWWHYEHTLDRHTLARYGWPLLQAIADFYLAYMDRDPATGRLSLPLAKLCEDTVFNVAPDQRLVRDPGLDLAAVHQHLRDTAAAATALGLDDDAIRYRTALAELNPVPVTNGEFALAPDCALDVPVSHPYTIAPIYPSGLVTALGPTQLLPIAERTLKNIWRCSSRVTHGAPPERLHWNDDLSMGWLGVARAWMGDGEGAADAVLNGWVAGCLKTNGFLSSQARAPKDRPQERWMQNQIGGTANVINELLLQSHSGVIQVFPAMPKAWRNAEFANLLARGAFRVAAQRVNGRTRWVTLTSLKGGTARLKNPWSPLPGTRIDLRIGDGKARILRPGRDGCFRIVLAAGETACLAPAGTDVSTPHRITPADQPRTPWSFTPAPATAAKPKDAWTSWWGKPARS